ncbi:MAG: cytochrome [Hyphomicrobiales bacterium]|nr:cytochrome [Hyphomicrobiales bacterium]
MRNAFVLAALAAPLVFGSPALAQGAAPKPPPPGASSCSGCHGAAGSDLPTLSGRSADEIAGSMAAFRSGERPATLMNRIAKGFTDEETRAIAQWIAAQGRAK